MDTTKSVNYSRPGSQDCFPVSLEVHQQQMNILVLWLALAIIFGILIGIILALIVFRFCCKKLWKGNIIIKHSSDNRIFCRFLSCCIPMTAMGKKSNQDGICEPIPISSRRSSDHDRRISLQDDSADVTSRKGAGMCDVVLKDSGDQADNELMKQDITAATEIEEELLENRKLVSEKLAVIHLNEKSEGTRSDKESIEKVMAEFCSHLTQTEQKLNADYKANLELLKLDPELIANEQKLLDEIKKLKASHKRKLHVLFKNSLEDFRELLRKNTKLSDKEIDEIVDKLKRSLANLEITLSDNVDEQTQFLENNLANRQYLLDQINDANENVDKKMRNYEETAKKSLQKLAEDHKISTQMKENLLKEFRESLQNVKNKHRSEIKAEMEKLAEKLRKQNSDRMEKLRISHKEQMAKHLKQAETLTDADKFLEMTRALLEQQNEEKQEEKMDLDKEEAAKLNQVYLKLEQSYEEALQKQLEMLKSKLTNEGKLNTNDVKNLLHEFEMDLRDMEKMRETERKLHLSTLREKLEERKRNLELETGKKDSDQKRISKQQDNMLQKVLDSQRELDDNDRHKILVEHEHNQLVLNSLLSISKLKHERLLEQKLAARRSAMAKNRTKTAQSSKNQKRRKSLKDILLSKSEPIIAENENHDEESMIEEKSKLTQELRDGLALETKVLMEQQDTNMADLIGRLQVSQARRQVVIDRQDKLVKKLEEELKQQKKPLTTNDVEHLDTILQDHRRQVDQLNKALESTRQKQLQNLQNKLEEKRIRNKKVLEAKFEAEEEDILAKSLNNKMSFATSLLCQNKLTARHQRALEHLDSELKAESERQKEHLDKELQKEMEKALLEQKKQFLGQLAAVIKMTPEQIKSMARHTTKDTNENSTNLANHQTTVESTESYVNSSRLPPIGKAPLSFGQADTMEISDNVHQSGSVQRKRRTKKRRAANPDFDRQHENDDSDTV